VLLVCAHGRVVVLGSGWRVGGHVRQLLECDKNRGWRGKNFEEGVVLLCCS
jgi:hypothetical protein